MTLERLANGAFFLPPEEYAKWDNSLSEEFVRDLARGLRVPVPVLRFLWLRLAGKVSWMQAPSLHNRQSVWAVSGKSGEISFIADQNIREVFNVHN